MEMVGLGELAGADRKGRSMIYTPMTNSQGERVGSVRFRARYYEGIRPYISRRQRPPPFDFLPFSLETLSIRFSTRDLFLPRPRPRIVSDSERASPYTRIALGIGFFGAREESNGAQPCVASDCEKVSVKPCNSIMHGEFASSRLTGKSMQSCKEFSSGVRRPFFRPGTSLSFSLSFATLRSHPPLPSRGGYFSSKEMFLTCILPPSSRSLLLLRIAYVLPLHTNPPF